jgi:prolyl-tRNA synthetase
MRWSATLIPTLRHSPAEAVARSHQLMVRAGLVRQVSSGSYAYLPLGMRALRKVAGIVREEMDASGAVEMQMPVLWPEELMRDTGRLEAFADDLVRFEDRHGRPHLLAPTHEEVVTAIVRDEVQSYRQLPITLYQIHTKFRDEPRPRFGVIRTREFTMKDAYSFSADEASMDESYRRMRAAYGRIMERCGLEYVCVEAGSGAMGGGESHEFMVPAEIGTGSFVRCAGCGYAANTEVAEAPAPATADAPSDGPELREVETPDRTTIDEVSEFLNVRPQQMIKTLVYLADGRPVAALVRGDHDVNEGKLRRALEAKFLELADPPTIREVTGAPVGFAGPVGLEGVRMFADPAVMAVENGVTGANRADAHMVGVVPGRDFAPDGTADIRFVMPEDRCPRCDGELQMRDGIEVGHIFKLGTKYSDALDAGYAGDDGTARPYQMGCYGLGIDRLLAAMVETNCDEDGIVWHPEAAPYEVLVMPLGVADEKVMAGAEAACETLEESGIDALLDDRDASPGIKFNDADLVGFPVRVVVGRRYADKGTYELQVRKTGERTDVPPEELGRAVAEKLRALSAGGHHG